MLYLKRVPHPPLSEFVYALWLYEGNALTHAKERVLPTGEMGMVINLAEDETRVYDPEAADRYRSFPGSLLTGAHSGYQVIDTAEQSSVIGVHFRPGGAFPFLRMPAGELRDTTVSLDTLWGAAAVELRDRLLEAATPAARFELLERVLSERLMPRLDRHAAVGFALRRFMTAPHMTTIGAVTDRIGLTPKRFIQVFRDETGFTPKVFCRIRRFQRALDRLQGRESVEWAAVALDCGYFDQAHFIHDFRAFSGINPSAYLVRQTAHRNHVAVAE
jgi:AraC-like DNA-binding protein